MPANDKYQTVLLNALKKSNWSIIREQVRLIVKNRYIFLDIQAKNQNNDEIILIGLKGFDVPSPVNHLGNVIGQYTLYRSILKHLDITYPLYLAVPKHVYDTFLQEEISQVALNDARIKLLVFDVDSEDIVLWID